MRRPELVLTTLLALAGGGGMGAVGQARGATDAIAVSVPIGDDVRPLLTVVGTVSRDGQAVALCSVLGAARLQPIPVAGKVLLEALPLTVGADEDDIPDSTGFPLCDEVAWLIPLTAGEAICLPVYGFPSADGGRYAYWKVEPPTGRRLWVRDAGGEEPTPLYHGDDFGFVEWSPDGRCLAVGGFLVPGHRGHQLTVVELESWKAIYECKKAYDACWSPDGRELAYFLARMEGGKLLNKELNVWDRQTAEVIPLGSFHPQAYGLRYSPDGQSLLCGVDRWKPWEETPGGGGEVWIVRREDGKARKVYEDASVRPTPLGWTTEGDACWLRAADGRVVLLDVRSDRPRKLFGVTVTDKTFADGAPAAAIAQAERFVRKALVEVAGANKAVADYCEVLTEPRQRLTEAAAGFRGVPAACPEALLLPGQCEQYAQAPERKATDLPVAACLARMKALAYLLAWYEAKEHLLPAAAPDLPEVFRKDPRLWTSPGDTPDQKYEIRYCAPEGGAPTPGQVVLECGPFGDQMVRARWREAEPITTTRPAISAPSVRLEPLPP
jgi:hypothetical protein